jgi:predicted metal-dependent peptidase
MEQILERIKIITSKLMGEYPFFSYLLTYCDIKISDEVPSMGVTNRGVMYVNEEWANKLSNEELAGVLVHEVLHLVYGHILEDINQDRDRQLLNIAFDLKVNQTVLEMNNSSNRVKLKLPDGGCIPDWGGNFKKFGFDIEEIPKKDSIDIYRELIKKPNSNPPKGFDEHMFDDDTPNPNMSINRDSMTREEAGEFWRVKTLQAGQHQKLCGVSCGALEEIIGEIEHPTQDWRQLLMNLISNSEVTDYSWSRPNRRSESLGVYLPTPVREELNVKIYVDTSGSVGTEELRQFLGEINGIIQQFTNVKLKVVMFDDDIRGVIEIDSELKELNVNGRGGTNFDAVMNEDNSDDNMIIIFTDGEAPYPTNRDKFNGEIIWCISRDGTDEYVKNTNDYVLEIK